MALPRDKQEVQEARFQLGVKFLQFYQNMIAICKGRLPITRETFWYYSSFLPRHDHHRRKQAHCHARSVWEARELLQAAHWIEEEDLRQDILEIVFRNRATYVHSKRRFRKAARYMKMKIWPALVQRIIHKYHPFQAKYNQPLDLEWATKYPGIESQAFELEYSDLSFVLNNKYEKRLDMNMFDRYLYYLDRGLKLTDREITDILGFNTRYTKKLIANMEDPLDGYTI